ncbi:MaoC family dehydratase [Salinibacterium sp. ZJ454]|uniref:MaoC family dehydratase n=1 Tax=Salinibacterium sp. ZJ454 TaxID=2708339 RepID=UPI001AB02AF3|nr:MaoC family dehydratase [Salinibacterium sp. ZJ454]
MKETMTLVANGGAPHVNGVITGDTPEGYELVGVSKRASIQLMGSRLWGRFNPNHWDTVFANETGLRAPIQTGEMSTAYICEMCVYHFGHRFFRGTRLQLNYVGSIHAGETVTTGGVVREKLPKGLGFRFVLDVWVKNEEGELKTVGVVEVDVDVDLP